MRGGSRQHREAAGAAAVAESLATNCAAGPRGYENQLAAR
jgi:hypothetical protein